MSDAPRLPPVRVPDFVVGDWLAEPALNRLSAGRTQLRMRPQLMDVLVCLARRQGRVVLKDELLADVWPDRIITESGMVRCIAELRQLLGDDPREPRYIETIAKRGYRLVAPVTWHREPPAVVPPGTSDAVRVADPEGPDAPGDRDSAHAPRVAEPPPGEPGERLTEPSPGCGASAAPRRPFAVRAPLVTAAVFGAVVTTLLSVSYLRRPARPVLTEADTVVLAFENTTGDDVFDDTLPLALAIQLEQSPFLHIVSAERVQQVLALMQRPPGTHVTRQLGLEICEREGAAGLIAGSLTPVGSRYVIGLEAFACASRESIGRQQVDVATKDEVLGALGAAATQLRLTLGESLASIATYDVPATEATTPSLDALRALRQGDAAGDRGQNAEALRLYRLAVVTDPDFALAQARLGTWAIGLHYEPEGVAALERAFALRGRVTLPERLEIDLAYHSALTGDRNRLTETLETMRRVYPRKLSARRRLARHYLDIGRYGDALVEALAAHGLEPDHAGAFTPVARAHLALGRLVDARAVLEQAVSRGVDSEVHHALLLQVGFLAGNPALIERERAWAATHAESVPYVLEAEAEDALWRGRLRASLALLERYQEWSRARGAEYRWIVLELRKARYEAICGFRARAMARASRQLARPDLGHDLAVEALKVAVSAGDVDRTAALVARFDAAQWPRGEEPYSGFVTAARAALATERQRPLDALALLKPLEPFEVGALWGLIPLHERARAHLAAGQWAEARQAYQRMLDHRGVVSGQKLLPLAQLGLARAGRDGEADARRAAYDAFFDLWKDADADLPLLAEARREYARLR